MYCKFRKYLFFGDCKCFHRACLGERCKKKIETDKQNSKLRTVREHRERRIKNG